MIKNERTEKVTSSNASKIAITQDETNADVSLFIGVAKCVAVDDVDFYLGEFREVAK